ncbi:MAG: 4Fe-4S single cluster domain-containing protein [Thermodesulfovibrionales bacterium]
MGTDGKEEIYIDLIHYPVLTLGIGKRIGIWFQGCSIRCGGCISLHTWMQDENGRTTLSRVMENIHGLVSSDVQGVTISGGEPFDQSNALLGLLERLRNLGLKDIMVFSGYEYTYLAQKYPRILESIDVLIDGRFIQGMESEYPWKGSDNQNMVLLTKDKGLLEKYFIYKNNMAERRLQVIKTDKVYVLGIPKQKDAEAIQYGFYQEMPNM